MNKCRKWNKLMIDSYYDELDPTVKIWFDQHREACSKCCSEWNDLTASLTLMGSHSRKDPGKVFWKSYWDKLADKFNDEPIPQKEHTGWKTKSKSFLLLPGWAVGTAAVLGLLIIGIFLGRLPPLDFGPSQIINTTLNALDQRTAKYLETSKLMMLGFENFDADNEDIHILNLPLQREKSDLLIKEAGYLKQELRSNSRHRLYQLVTDLEVILLQIANIESEEGITAVEIVKSGVETRSILFKINLEEMKKLSKLNNEVPQQSDKKTI